MSPMMEEMLVKEVVPRLRAAARSIPKIGSEDDEEITQDTTLMAARMMDSAEMLFHCPQHDAAHWAIVALANDNPRFGLALPSSNC